MSAPRRAALQRVVAYIPPGRRTNEDLVVDQPGWTAEKIEEKTGIVTRCKAADDEFSTDLAVAAGERLIDSGAIDRESIDALIVVTVTPDQLMPFTAAQVQRRLGLPTTVGAFDVTLACSGYPYALSLAASLVEAGRADNVVVITTDRFTFYADPGEFGSKTLFGDAAAASLVTVADPAAPTGGLLGRSGYGTDGNGEEHLFVPTSGLKGWAGQLTEPSGGPTFHMNGPEVFDFSLRTVSKFLKRFLADEELAVGDVDHFVFHQANLFMLEHLRKRMKIEPENFVVHMRETGNTSSSTIPICLAHLQDEGRIEPGQCLVLVGFGMGYSWSAIRVDWR